VQPETLDAKVLTLVLRGSSRTPSDGISPRPSQGTIDIRAPRRRLAADGGARQSRVSTNDRHAEGRGPVNTHAAGHHFIDYRFEFCREPAA
jgi:hypothetical protein